MSDTHKGESEPTQKAVHNSEIVERILKPHYNIEQIKGLQQIPASNPFQNSEGEEKL
jgi:hypothetical protein